MGRPRPLRVLLSRAPAEAALREAKSVTERMERGRLQPSFPFGLTYAIVWSIAQRQPACRPRLPRRACAGAALRGRRELAQDVPRPSAKLDSGPLRRVTFTT